MKLKLPTTIAVLEQVEAMSEVKRWEVPRRELIDGVMRDVAVTMVDAADLDRALARIAELEQRLEIYVLDEYGHLVQVPDGIDCRDETIKLLDARVARLTRERDALQQRLGEAELLLAGWRTTHEEGRHSNAPINSTRQWLAALTPALQAKESV